jgi:hypothetical protein
VAKTRAHGIGSKRLRRHTSFTIKISLLLQIIHTALAMTSYTLNRLISPHPYYRSSGDKLVPEIPSLSERLSWDQIFFLCAALAFEAILWRYLSKMKNVTWIYLGVMTSATTLYLLFVTQTYSLPLLIPDMLLLISVFLGFIALWLSRKDFEVPPIAFIQIAAALILSISVIYISGRYFPDGVIDWAIPMPVYVDLMAVSRFSYSESILILCLICHLAIRLAFFRSTGMSRMQKSHPR